MRTRDDLWDWVWEEGWADPELDADFDAAARQELEDFEVDLWEEPATAAPDAPAGVLAPPPVREAASEPMAPPAGAAPLPQPAVRPAPAPPV
ncbi:MAG TPA: hypothetical protein VHL78_01400, partial [Actinomycetota bacterium]|nr:hypothetical protein [Actinomycetota bacterium]